MPKIRAKVTKTRSPKVIQKKQQKKFQKYQTLFYETAMDTQLKRSAQPPRVVENADPPVIENTLANNSQLSTQAKPSISDVTSRVHRPLKIRSLDIPTVLQEPTELPSVPRPEPEKPISPIVARLKTDAKRLKALSTFETVTGQHLEVSPSGKGVIPTRERVPKTIRQRRRTTSDLKTTKVDSSKIAKSTSFFKPERRNAISATHADRKKILRDIQSEEATKAQNPEKSWSTCSTVVGKAEDDLFGIAGSKYSSPEVMPTNESHNSPLLEIGETLDLNVSTIHGTSPFKSENNSASFHCRALNLPDQPKLPPVANITLDEETSFDLRYTSKAQNDLLKATTPPPSRLATDLDKELEELAETFTLDLK